MRPRLSSDQGHRRGPGTQRTTGTATSQRRGFRASVACLRLGNVTDDAAALSNWLGFPNGGSGLGLAPGLGSPTSSSRGETPLSVTDDGAGGADPNGSGLSGLAQRVSTVDGRLEIASPPGGPTRVTVELPLRA